MASSTQAEYDVFEEKVKRTVYIDNLSPQVTEPVLRTALGQFGTVRNVQFIPNYLEPRNIPQCALVEMENSKQAKAIVTEMINFPFMMSGMPRPVRAGAAEAEMFDERPIKPGRKIVCRWLNQNDPDFEVAKKQKRLSEKHAMQASFLFQQQLQEEAKLAEQQSKNLKANHKKYESIDNVIVDGSARRLAHQYRMNVAGES